MATVLVVDDRSINREFLETLLGYAGHRTLEAADGAEALALARAARPDLVIADILMPVMDGVELARRLRRDPHLADVPVVFYTATYRIGEARELADSCGVTWVLPKPSEPQAILDVVAAALGREPAVAPAAAVVHGTLVLETPPPEGLVELERMLLRTLEQSFPGDPAAPSAPRAAVHALSLRLAALLELALVLPNERDPQRLIELFGRASRDILNARYSAVAMGARGDRPRRVAILGMEAAVVSAVAEALDLRAGVLGEAIEDGRPRRLELAPGELPPGLPAVHPAVRSLVVAPIISGSRARGWLYVADRIGAERFDAGDEQLAMTLAALIAPIYDNLVLYGELEEHARDLERQRDRIARLTRVQAVLSGINSAIVRIRDRGELLDEACRIAVTGGAYRLAWIGRIDPATGAGEVVARAGAEAAFLDSVHLSALPDTPYSDRPASRAVRDGRPVVCNDIAADPLLVELKGELLGRGHRSVAALPLVIDGEIFGVLSLHAAETGRFDDEEMALLLEVAGDISFGLQYIEKEERLAWLAYYDALTGLPNAALFQERLGQLLRDNGPNRAVAVMMVDLDGFTQLNDTLGRHTGDALLRAAGERLQNQVAEPGLVARTGADSFGLAVVRINDAADAATMLDDRVLAALSRPFAIDHSDVRISARGGIALHPTDGADAATLIKNAEAALKRAQITSRRYLFYAPEISARAAERLALENRLRRALEDQAFVLHYQPKVRAEDGRPVGLEALIRWHDPTEGLVPPGRFIPVLEASGMIVEVGRWVLARALADWMRWRKEGLEPPRVAVNVSSFELAQRDFAGGVEATIGESGAQPRALELEITESLIMADVESNVASLRRLGGLGVAVAVDDFGTGHSSLSYLAKLPVDALKIDRSFIAGMMTESDSMSIVSTIISLAHALNLKVVAEGVEMEEQAKFLRLMKCDEMQGFLFSRPMPFDDVVEYLQATGPYRMP